MSFNFNKLVNRENSACEKYDARTQIFSRADIIPMWVADMDFETPDFIVDAMKRRLEHPIFGYSFRDQAYNSSIVGWVARRSGWKIEATWLDFAPGVVAGLVYAIQAFSTQGDGVVIQTPIYPPFMGVTTRNHRRVLENPLKEQDGIFTIDFEDLDAKLSKAKIFMMSNPHNPTGRAYTLEELRRIGELCVKHDVTILSDEIHSDIIQSPHRHIHIASICKEFADRTVTMIAPSKTFNLAGLSTSVSIVSNPQMRERLYEQTMTMHADQGNILGAVALQAAYNYGDSWVDQMNEYVGANMDYVVEFLSRNIPSIRCRKSEATYMLLLDFRAWLEDMTHEQIYSFLIDEAHLGLNTGTRFGERGTGWFRLNVATPLSVVEKAMEQLLEATEHCR